MVFSLFYRLYGGISDRFTGDDYGTRQRVGQRGGLAAAYFDDRNFWRAYQYYRIDTAECCFAEVFH